MKDERQRRDIDWETQSGEETVRKTQAKIAGGCETQKDRWRLKRRYRARDTARERQKG
jgi:hypothetical protein